VDIDRFSGVPPYVQIAQWLAGRIRAGELPGRLPSARDIIQETGVAQFTAIKGLRLLREQGWARVSPGLGTFAAEPADWPEHLPGDG
jgi:DNA-binding GntR family transcriptional regulator